MKSALLPVLGFLILALLPPSASAQIPDFAAANHVLGQSNFTTDQTLDPPTASSLNGPAYVFRHAASGKIFVADQFNHRVLRYPSEAAFVNGAAAEAVLGQATFADKQANQGAADPAANTLDSPAAVFVDDGGRMWIADAGNNRIVRHDSAVTVATNANATLVLGQLVFTTDASGLTGDTMSSPIRVWVDQNDRLWVADSGNNRVLRFDNISLLANGANALGVLGQPDFVTNTLGTSQTKMNGPGAVVVDGSGRLWVADSPNHRVLRFDNAASLPNNAPADAVLGQANFVTNTPGFSSAKFNTPISLAVDGGRLWVADALNNRILRFENAATKTNGATADGLLGQPDFSTTSSAVTANKLSAPVGVYATATGSLWVAEQTPNRVLRFDPPSTNVGVPPTLAVKGRRKIETNKGRIVLRGTASANTTRVTFNAGGGFKNARGTTNWKAVIRLDPKKARTTVKLRAISTDETTSKIIRVKITRVP